LNGWVNNMLPKQEDGFKIPINQQVTGASMSNQEQEMQHKIHIRTMMNPDPDFLDLEPHISLQELIEHHITFNAEVFSDFYDEVAIQNKVKNILYDREDDKIGRIKDLYDAEIKSIAKFIAENYETNTFAKWAYEDTISHVI
jgi:hypothetical protein